jgi:hypothetical protein
MTMARAKPFTTWMPDNEMIATRFAERNEDGTQGSIRAFDWCQLECEAINRANPAQPVMVVRRVRGHGGEVALAR